MLKWPMGKNDLSRLALPITTHISSSLRAASLTPLKKYFSKNEIKIAYRGWFYFKKREKYISLVFIYIFFPLTHNCWCNPDSSSVAAFLLSLISRERERGGEWVSSGRNARRTHHKVFLAATTTFEKEKKNRVYVMNNAWGIRHTHTDTHSIWGKRKCCSLWEKFTFWASLFV